MGRSGGGLSGKHDRNLALHACVDVLQAMSESPTLSQLRSGPWRFVHAQHNFEERKYDSLPPWNRLSLVLREGPQKNLVRSTDSSEVPPKPNFLLVLHSLPVFQTDCPQHMQCWSIPSPIPPLCLEACLVSHGTPHSSWTDTIQVQWLLAKHNLGLVLLFFYFRPPSTRMLTSIMDPKTYPFLESPHLVLISFSSVGETAFSKKHNSLILSTYHLIWLLNVACYNLCYNNLSRKVPCCFTRQCFLNSRNGACSVQMLLLPWFISRTLHQCDSQDFLRAKWSQQQNRDCGGWVGQKV